MKTRILLIVLLALIGLSIKVTAQIPTWQWIKTAECSSNTAYGEGYNLASDFAGNVYLTGVYSNIITFGSDTLIDTGAGSVYLVKYNSQGDVIWAKTSVSSGTGVGVADRKSTRLNSSHLGI